MTRARRTVMVAIPLVVGVGLVMLAVERLAGARALPAVRGFHARAIVLSAAQAAVVWFAGVTWDPWLRAHRLVSADALGLVGGALAGYVVLTFVYYWWHRARHAVPFLWRWFHQVHHSPA